MQSPKRCKLKHTKSRYQVRNWVEYEAGLRRRGNLPVWLSEEALTSTGLRMHVGHLRKPQGTGPGESFTWEAPSRRAQDSHAAPFAVVIVVRPIFFSEFCRQLRDI